MVSMSFVDDEAISKISGTMAELRAMNEETSRRRREVRLYLASQARKTMGSPDWHPMNELLTCNMYVLHERETQQFWEMQYDLYIIWVSICVREPPVQAVSYELVTRIMRFVDYKLEKVSANNMDATLISPTLQLELYINQRADYLSQMPIFALAQECYPDAWRRCDQLSPEIGTFATLWSPKGRDFHWWQM